MKTNINLVPDIVNPTPDYYCTWQTQLFATCDGKPEGQRAIIGEKALFDVKKPYGWAYFYEQVRKDLILVMDDSWDVPVENDGTHYGSLLLNKEKFPEATHKAESNAEALKKLVDRVKTLGWKGLGGWVCAQKCERFTGNEPSEEYWIQRFTDMQKSGFAYWKVDWGKEAGDFNFRKMLTDLGKKIAPHLTIEHAWVKEVIPFSDVYRTYDVPAIMSIPMTMNKLEEFVTAGKVKDGYAGLINCEDEAYMAAAGGFAMGIMRHPYKGKFVDGKADMSFPEVHRNLKTKIYEVVRAARWHRIAPAFGVDCDNTYIGENKLTDSWHFVNKEEEIEEWWFEHDVFSQYIMGDTVKISAPEYICRNCEPPAVTADENGNVPYIVGSKNPNGVFSVATLGRTIERKYEIPKCDMVIDVGEADFIGVFGEYKNLILKTSCKDIRRILMQDLADDRAYDVTKMVAIDDDKITISGELINKIGTIAQPDDDISEPGVVIKLEKCR